MNEPAINNMPHSIVFGATPHEAAVRVRSDVDENEYLRATAVPKGSDAAGRLSAVIQAVPTLLVEEGHRGKRIMEVVINGDLVRAKGGEGLRAWAVDANNRITEHAKLFEPERLQSVVNAAAVWQVASVVVAQKHLADISARLDALDDGVRNVSDFLDEGRRSVVEGTYRYLRLAAETIGNGELSPHLRSSLEDCEQRLLQVESHLLQELSRRLAPTERNESFGTGQTEKKMTEKYRVLSALVEDIRLMLKTRALAWYVLSLYPGESALKRVRLDDLLRSFEHLRGHLENIRRVADEDCKTLSFWGIRKVTLSIREANVLEAAEELCQVVLDVAASSERDVRSAEGLLSAHDAPTRILFEVEGGRIGDARVALEATAA